MSRVLFVSNGHGESAIADRIAAELRRLLPQAQLDHLALVGERASATMREVGPRAAMPSGGLIAMGNLPNIWRDLRAGLLGLVVAQRSFVRRARGTYDAVVAVGDTFALTMALQAKTPTVFVGTAKSVRVARYGAFEKRLLARAAARFVRDEATAASLRTRGLVVEPAANVIVDLFTPAESLGDDETAAVALDAMRPAVVLLPGSREGAYADAAFLLAVVREIAAERAGFGAVLSIAPGLDVRRFAECAADLGFEVERGTDAQIPFTLKLGQRTVVLAWTGSLGPLFRHVHLALGQAGTANEGAAACGVPVIAFERARRGRTPWYRRRQQGLLGEGLRVIDGTLADAVAGVRALLDDPELRQHMSESGRAAMGPPGGAHRIAARVALLAGG